MTVNFCQRISDSLIIPLIINAQLYSTLTAEAGGL